MEQTKHAGGRPPKRKVVTGTLEEAYYTVREVAEILRIHPNTVRKMIREGELPAQTIGKGFKIARVDLEERFRL